MEDNVEVDAFANMGSSLRIPSNMRIPIIHVMIRANEDPSKRSEDPNNHDQIANITTIQDPDPQHAHQDPSRQNNQDPTRSCIKLIIEYLQDDTIPKKRKATNLLR